MYVEQIALFSLISSELEVLADFFGSYKWATLGKHLISHIQLMYEQLQQKFKHALDVVHGVAQSHYRSLSQKNQTHKSWCQNFRDCQPLMSELVQTTTSLESKVKSVQTAVEQNGSPRRIRQMEHKLRDTVRLMNQFCLFNNISAFSQQAVNEAIGPSDAATNEARAGLPTDRQAALPVVRRLFLTQ